MPENEDGKTFLVIEDSAEDAALIRLAFATVKSCRAFVCRNLSEARAYVHGAGMYADRERYPFPNAVICDLRLGGESGVEFVAWLKSTPNFMSLPIIILSSSPTPKDLIAAKSLGAVDVLQKPARFEDLRAMLADMAGKLCT